ncbi:hypothetical protein ACOYR1_15430 [Thalassotalea piscium]
MLKHGGNGYFRTRVVADYLASGALEQVKGSSQFSYPIYLTYRTDRDSKTLHKTLACLKESLAIDTHWQV